MKTNCFFVLLIWLLLSGGSQIIKAQNETIELELKQHSDALVCGEDEDKRFTISVSVGEVKSQDSLYAIQVFFTYNPEKMMFVNLLDKNTLAEFFEIKGFNVIDTGLFTAYATTMGFNQATGKKPLIAFEVKYLGNCSDSLHINLDDIELDISQSFLSRLNYKDKKLIIDVKTKETENSFVGVSFLQDTVKEFDDDSLANILIGLNTNNLTRIDSLDFEIKYKKNEIFELTDIDLFDAGLSKMIIDSIMQTEDGDSNKIIIKTHLFSNISNENVMRLKCKQIKKKDDTVRLDIKVSRINDCSCATSFKGDRVFILSQKDTTAELSLQQNNDAWICGDDGRDKNFIISVDVGEIKDSDSLFAIQVWLTFNPEKLTFVNLIDKNTLAEFFEIKDFDLLEPGEVTAYAKTMGINQAVGNKPLLALEAKYLGDCPDSAHINLKDIELDVSKRFNNRLNYKDTNLIVNVRTKETEKSFVKVNFQQDTLKEFAEDSTISALINLNTNDLAKVDSLEFEIKYEINENFEYVSFVLLDSNNTKIVIDTVSVYEVEDSAKINVQSRLLESINDETVMKILMKQIKKDDDTVRIDINVSKINECACATSFIGDKVFILSKKDTTTPIVTDEIENKDIDINGYYSFISDEFVINTLRSYIDEIILYDLMGRMIENKGNIKDYNEVRIPADSYLKGIYLAHIKLLNKVEKNIVLIKN